MQICQVTELSKPRSGKGTHTDSGVSVRLSSELLENRVRNKLLNKNKIKYKQPAKDQPGCGFTVRQGATTIHEDSPAYNYGLDLQLDSGRGGNSHPYPPLVVPQEAVRLARSDHWLASRKI